MSEPLVVRDEFLHFLRPLTGAERECLENHIRQDGCRDPLTVWPDPETGQRVLIDGHSRYEICQRLGVPFQTVEREFADAAEARRWMVQHARARRNQTRTERNYYIGLHYLEEKQPHGGERSKSKSVALDRDSTADRIASEERCSHQHVKNCARLAEHINALALHVGMDLKWGILAEQIQVTPKVAERLLELPKGEALDVLHAAKDARKNEAEPVKASAISKELKKLDGESEPAEPAEPDLIDRVRTTGTSILAAAMDAKSAGDVEQMIGILKTYVAKLEMVLESKKAGAA